MCDHTTAFKAAYSREWRLPLYYINFPTKKYIGHNNMSLIVGNTSIDSPAPSVNAHARNKPIPKYRITNPIPNQAQMLIMTSFKLKMWLVWESNPHNQTYEI